MGDPQGFIRNRRQTTANRPIAERTKDFKEIPYSRDENLAKTQASRCMDCGTPFCHSKCPINNIIPEWNDNIYKGKWEKAFIALNLTNNLPEITGRICPALCEYGCVLSINDDPVTIRENELSIIENAFKFGYIKPNPPKKRTGKKVAIIGSGPAGLSCADELNKLGHKSVVFEKDDNIGGILRYGIPDFKLEKRFLDRRINLWKKEGIIFKPSVNVGVDYPVKKLLREFDAICITIGSSIPRDLNVEGRSLSGIHFAMDFLIESNKKVGARRKKQINLNAKDKKVVVIGGGDTGADCIGVARRQGASSIVQIEILPCPPKERTYDMPWPLYPVLYKTGTSHEEGVDRLWCVTTKKFIGSYGKVEKIECANVEFKKEIPNSTFFLEADLIILALGFLHPMHEGLLSQLKVKFDSRGNIETDSNYMTSKKGVFAAGDSRRGQSLVVWAIYEGRQAAYTINRFLM